MKYVYWAAGLVVALIAFVFVLQIVASERVEVIELHTLDAEGQAETTRLWIVDDEGLQYLRSGSGDSGWLARIQANGTFELTRNGTTRRYEAELRPEKRDRINALMQEKYTWGNTLIGILVGSREAALPVELHPL